MEKPVVSIWGVGPSYRLRVKKHIEESLNSGYENIMDFVILTDDINDFDELRRKTDKIKAVIDIHEEREKSLWPKTEYIPNHLDEKNYGQEYIENLKQDKQFCYSLKRFALPKLLELGYTKFIMLDGDVKIKYDKINVEFTEEEFWEEFNTPPNSMKGCVKEVVHVERGTNTFRPAAAMGYDASYVGLQVSSIVLNKMYENHSIDKYPIVQNLEITEGPFRYYHFSTPQKVKEYFDAWDEINYIFLSNRFFRSCNLCGGYMLCDYLIYGVTNLFTNTQTLNFPNKIYNRRIFYEDRYFLPPAAAGMGLNFNDGKTIEDFYEKNKDLVEKIESIKAWPHIEHN